jgi:hypothetical protein
VGETASTNYGATAGALRRNHGGGERDAFVTRLRLPTITTVSAASFQGGAPLAPESVAAGYGPEMSPVTQVAPDGQPLPASLGGVDAPVQYAGAHRSMTGLDQVNSQVPRSLKGRGPVDLVLTVSGRQANTVRLNFQ